jgi:hypothetical protein
VPPCVGGTRWQDPSRALRPVRRAEYDWGCDDVILSNYDVKRTTINVPQQDVSVAVLVVIYLDDLVGREDACQFQSADLPTNQLVGQCGTLHNSLPSPESITDTER